MRPLITIALVIVFALGADAALCLAFSAAAPPLHMGLFIGPELHAKFLAEERIAFAERFAIFVAGLLINGGAIAIVRAALRRHRGEKERPGSD